MNILPKNLVRVFIPFALGFFLSYIYRVVNAVIGPELAMDLNLDPSVLGLLTSAYFLTFAAFQLPLGVLLDRFGPRKVETCLLIFAGIGAFIFSKADSASALIIGRAFIGLGVSACLMAAFKAYSMWFPTERLPLINGFQMSAGGIGALTATAPVEAMLDITDWRGVFSLLSFLTLAVSAIIFFVGPKKKVDATGESFKDQLGGVAIVFKSPFFWRLAPWTAMSHSTFLAVQSLWSGPWLRDVAGYDRVDAANVLLLVALGMISGFIIMETLAERLTHFGIKPVYVAASGMTMFMIVQVAIIMDWTSLTLPAWTLFGFFGTTGIICYAVLSQNFPLNLVGRANTAINMLIFVTALASQWGLGMIINLWPVAPDGRYAPPAYQWGFGLLLALQVMGMIYFIISKPKGRAQ